jgi:DNA replication and repair protein RecF
VHLESLKIEGWRNLQKQTIGFSPRVNCLVGENGQGKTNVLEALFFVVAGFSPRSAKSEQLINWSGNFFFMQGVFKENGQPFAVEMGVARDGRRVNKVNGSVIKRLSQLAGLLNAVFFMPEDLLLVKGSPSLRRRFMDIELCQLSLTYRGSLSQYTKVLRERNALLKQHKTDPVLLSVLTESLVKEAIILTGKRREFIHRLNPLLRLAHRRLSGNREELQLTYKANLPSLEPDQVLSKFQELAPSERGMKTTLLGPHRDDLDFDIHQANLKDFGSQGQQRTAVLALKLAEVELFRAERGKYPLLLLDDVFSELDSNRRQALLVYLDGKIQTFITSTDVPPDISRAKLLRVHAGLVREE